MSVGLLAVRFEYGLYVFGHLSKWFVFVLMFKFWSVCRLWNGRPTIGYNLFIDESGDHGLSNLNPDFPIFLLCGIIISSENYEELSCDFNAIKKDIWKSNHVIFHSRDIRKC